MTVMAKVHEFIFPEASSAVQVTVVLPTEKRDPDGGLQAKVTPGQLSVTVGFGKLTDIGKLLVIDMLEGQVICGGSTSLTVMAKVHEARVAPDASVEVQVTVLVPTGKKEPDGGLHITLTPGQLSGTVGSV